MEYRKIIYFLKVAETSNFTRAAKELFISPQALSKQIQELESILEYPLLIRNTVKVELTKDGKALYDRFVGLRDSWESAWKESLTKKQIQIAFFANLPDGSPLEKIINYIAEQYINWDVQISAMDIPQIIEKLQTDQIDLALTIAYEGENYPEYQMFHLHKDASVAYLPAGHPLEKHEELSLQDLMNNTVLFVNNTSIHKGSIFDKIKNTGKVAYTGDNLSIQQALQIKKGILLLPRIEEMGKNKNIISRPLATDAQFWFSICLLFKKNHPNAAQFEKIGQICSIS